MLFEISPGRLINLARVALVEEDPSGAVTFTGDEDWVIARVQNGRHLMARLRLESTRAPSAADAD